MRQTQESTTEICLQLFFSWFQLFSAIFQVSTFVSIFWNQSLFLKEHTYFLIPHFYVLTGLIAVIFNAWLHSLYYVPFIQINLITINVLCSIRGQGQLWSKSKQTGDYVSIENMFQIPPTYFALSSPDQGHRITTYALFKSFNSPASSAVVVKKCPYQFPIHIDS